MRTIADKQRVQPPAQDPESREKQLMNLAYNLAEKQLSDGTASPSVIAHFLKLATKREALEREILEKQKTLMEAKTESLNKDRENEQIARAAIEAVTRYRSSVD